MQAAALVLENRILYLEKMNNKLNRKIEDAKTKKEDLKKFKDQTKQIHDYKKQKLDQRDKDFQNQKQKIQDFKTARGERLTQSKIGMLSNSTVIAKTTKETVQVD